MVSAVARLRRAESPNDNRILSLFDLDLMGESADASPNEIRRALERIKLTHDYPKTLRRIKVEQEGKYLVAWFLGHEQDFEKARTFFVDQLQNESFRRAHVSHPTQIWQAYHVGSSFSPTGWFYVGIGDIGEYPWAFFKNKNDAADWAGSVLPNESGNIPVVADNHGGTEMMAVCPRHHALLPSGIWHQSDAGGFISKKRNCDVCEMESGRLPARYSQLLDRGLLLRR